MKLTIHIWFKILISIIIAVVVIVACYVSYVFLSYNRIPDNTVIDVNEKGNVEAETGKIYTAVTYNIGFGAYTPDYTFFMDGGKESRARSESSVIECITGSGNLAKSYDPDIVLFQEVDIGSTRSFHLNEEEILDDIFADYDSAAAVNYHSAYLFYPLACPHGASNSEIETFADLKITSSLRRSLPISTSFSKMLDLDRCYSVNRIPVNDGRELVVYNVHMSAYGGSDEVRAAQMTMLFDDMQNEYENGNYCLCGGDFNHDFTGDSIETLNGYAPEEMEWAMPFPDDLLPSCLYRAMDYSGQTDVGSCRNDDVPYDIGNFTVIVDGFILSDNIDTKSVEIMNNGFLYSDHNPVVLKFALNGG